MNGHTNFVKIEVIAAQLMRSKFADLDETLASLTIHEQIALAAYLEALDKVRDGGSPVSLSRTAARIESEVMDQVEEQFLD